MLGCGKGMKKHEALHSKNEDWPQIVAILSGSLAPLTSGALFAFSSPAIPKLLTDDYNFTIDEASYLTVIPGITMMIVTPIFCISIDKIGRKYTLLTTGVFYIISWLLFAFAKHIAIFYLSRVFTGIADAGYSASLPVYIAEVTTPQARSLYGGIMIMAIFIGQFTSNCIGFYFSIQTASLIMLVFPVLLVLTFAFMPQSPYWLIMKGNIDAAGKSLQRLRNREEVQEELKQINFDVQRQLSESGRFQDLWVIKSNRKALAIANLSRLFQQLSGFGCVITYSQYIFQHTGGGGISSGIAAMIVSGVTAFINIFANIISDKLGRNNSMVISCFGSGIVLLTEAIYTYLETYGIVDTSAVNWIPIAGIVVYAMTFCIGLGVVPNLIVGEIFSANIRKYGVAITNISLAAYSSTINKMFQLGMSAYGLWVPFLIFSLCCFANSAASYFIIPETKGKTLEEIQQMLKGNKTTTKC